MELSGFIEMSKNFKSGMTSDYKEMIFVKFDNKVYIMITSVGDVIMPFEELMKHKYLKTYYELSLMAIGKPNIDKDYYGTENPDYIPKKYEICHYMYVDVIYIVKNSLTSIREAKKGNSYQLFNLKKLNKMNVSSAEKIAAFKRNYKVKYGFEYENFEDRATTFNTLVNGL
uniref:Uncharacterized protein n=1 Tax=viral metagenome TaxID=1070528 RepID=A0A6C0I9H2_9ZZZZ